MEDRETTEYIRKHMAGGHSEASLRQHFLSYGWTQAKVDDAFEYYRRSSAPKAVSKASRPKRVAAWRRWSKKRWAKTILALVVAGGLIALAVHLLWPRPAHAPTTAKPHLTHQQTQSIDIITIGGAVGQYTTANAGALPTRTVAASNGDLELCNAACDPENSVVSQLGAYKASNVKIVPYAASLTAPDEQTIYLVAAAKCSSPSVLGGTSDKPRAMVILYETVSGTTPKQHCVTL